MCWVLSEVQLCSTVTKCTANMSKRNLKCLTLNEKIKLIAEVEKGEKKKKDIAEQFGIPHNTLSTILKNKDKLLERKNYTFNNKRKRLKACVNDDIDKAMFMWVTTARAKNIPLSGSLIREKAKEFAAALGREEFSASIGWLDKFKSRHNIVQMSLCGESGSADFQCGEEWQKNVLPTLISQYDKNNIFNADETGLFFKCLPNKTLAFKGQKCFGGKNSKERVTVMVGSNMSGSEKLKLLVIGKTKHPRCFKGIKSLEVDYECNRKAWMTSEIYENWLLKLDKQFAAQKRKVLLFVDNCPAHPKTVAGKLKNIKLEYFPPNLTSILQPMDQGIIKNLKQHYRKRIIMKMLAHLEEPTFTSNVSLLDAIKDLNKAWNNDVKTQTIANCFRKAGFSKDDLVQDANDWDEDDILPLSEFKKWWVLCGTAINTNDVEFEEYVDIDHDVSTMDFPSDEDILESVIKHLAPSEIGKFTHPCFLCSKMPHFIIVLDTDEDEDTNENQTDTTGIPTLNEAFSAIENLRRFVSSRENVPYALHGSLNLLEDFITNEKWTSVTQRKITDFFNKNLM